MGKYAFSEELEPLLKECYEKGIFKSVSITLHHKGAYIHFDKEINDERLKTLLENELYQWWCNCEFEYDGTIVLKKDADGNIDYDYRYEEHNED
jgi:hypothetical protein